MSLEIQFKLKENPIYLKYLHENSYWYKILNRNPNLFSKFIEELKINYKLRPVDKLYNAIEAFEMFTNIFSTLN